MPDLDCCIEHHPRRAERIPWLLSQLDGPATVVTDPTPDAPLTSSWRTYRKCLAHAPETGHLLILQDDVVPCRNLFAAAKEIGKHNQHAVVCLWHGSQPVRGAMIIKIAMQHDERYARIRATPWPPLVAALWPAEIARRFDTWFTTAVQKRLLSETLRSDDGVAARFLTQQRIPVYASVPSLVEHPDTDSIRKQPRGRVALNFIGDTDPLSLNWNPSAGTRKARVSRA